MQVEKYLKPNYLMAIFMWFFSLLMYEYFKYYTWNKEKIVFNNNIEFI